MAGANGDLAGRSPGHRGAGCRPHHDATVPHALVVAPGLVVDKAYVGYWLWGRLSIYQLWEDLQELFARIKADFDPTTPKARAAWETAQ
jgi:hypothetical protein